MKTVTRSLLLSYSPISSDQLVELYCRRVEAALAIYSKYVASYSSICYSHKVCLNMDKGLLVCNIQITI